MRVRAKTVTKTISKTVQQAEPAELAATPAGTRVKASSLQPGVAASARVPASDDAIERADPAEMLVHGDREGSETWADPASAGPDAPTAAHAASQSAADSPDDGGQPAWIQPTDAQEQPAWAQPTDAREQPARPDAWAESGVLEPWTPELSAPEPWATETAAQQVEPSAQQANAWPDDPPGNPAAQPYPAAEAIVQTTCSGRPYTVRRGDSYQLIARRFGVSVRALLDANPELQPGRMMVGDVLCIPQHHPTFAPPPSQTPAAPIAAVQVPTSAPAQPLQPTASAPVQAASAPAAQDRHRVQEGESIADILVLGDVSLNAFQEANPGLRLGQQRVGDALRMPTPGARGQGREGRPIQLNEGEDIHALADRLGLSVGMLLRANPHLRPSDFRAGQVVFAANATSQRG